MLYNAHMTIQELLKLAGDQGKVVVVDEAGDVKGVFLSYESYQQTAGTSLASVKPVAPDPEIVNREILEAQLQDDAVLPAPAEAVQSDTAERLDSLLSRRAEQLFRAMPHRVERDFHDLRSEVIDPNFNFNAPDVSTDDEVIKPNFDDI